MGLLLTEPAGYLAEHFAARRPKKTERAIMARPAYRVILSLVLGSNRRNELIGKHAGSLAATELLLEGILD